MSSEDSSSESESEREAVEGEDRRRRRSLPEGAPRIASGALIEGGDDEELRSNFAIANSAETARELAAACQNFSFSLIFYDTHA